MIKVGGVYNHNLYFSDKKIIELLEDKVKLLEEKNRFLEDRVRVLEGK